MFRFLLKYLPIKLGRFSVTMFEEEMNDFAIEKKLTNYSSVKDKNIDEKSDSIDVFYKLLEFVRVNRIYEGTLDYYINNGTVDKLLEILKKRYEAVDKAVEYFANLPKNRVTTVFECFAEGANFILERDCSKKESFVILYEFDNESKKRKLRKHNMECGEIGMPWVGRFYRI